MNVPEHTSMLAPNCWFASVQPPPPTNQSTNQSIIVIPSVRSSPPRSCSWLIIAQNISRPSPWQGKLTSDRSHPPGTSTNIAEFNNRSMADPSCQMICAVQWWLWMVVCLAGWLQIKSSSSHKSLISHNYPHNQVQLYRKIWIVDLRFHVSNPNVFA